MSKHNTRTAHQSRRRFLMASGAVLVGSSLAACDSKSPAPPAPAPAVTPAPPSAPTPIALHVGLNPWPGVMPLMTAVEHGLYKGNGLDLKVTLFASISQMMEAFNARRIDATIIDPGTLLVSAASGIAQKFVFVTDFSNGADAIVVADSVKSIKDFKGQKVSAEVGSIGHFLLLTALKSAGLDAKDVKLSNQTADQALAAFASGNTRIAVSYEPFISQAMGKRKARVIFSTRDAPIAPDVLSMHQDFLDKNPEATGRFIKTWYDTLAWREKNMDAAVAVEAKALDVKPEDFNGLSDGVRIIADPAEVLKYLSTGNADGPSLEKAATELGAFLRAQKLLDKDPPALTSLIDTSALEKYLASRA